MYCFLPTLATVRLLTTAIKRHTFRQLDVESVMKIFWKFPRILVIPPIKIAEPFDVAMLNHSHIYDQ